MTLPPPRLPDQPPLNYGGRRPRPWWVQTGLAGLPSRGWAVGFAVLSLAIAVGSAVAAAFYPWAFVGVLMIFAAWWYWASVRWVDRYDHWD